MSRTKKIIRGTLSVIGALIVMLVIAVMIIVHTDWFRSFARLKIISATEAATGGRAEAGSFNFYPSQMRVVITDFVIHGDEPAGVAPLLRVARIDVQVRLLPEFGHLFEISYAGVEQPRANIIVLADGRTNIPSPKENTAPGGTPLQTIVDLAIGRFQLTNGLIALESRKQALNVRGNNLRALIGFNPATQDYKGTISMEPVYVVAGRNTPVTARITVPVELRRNRIEVRSAGIFTQESAIHVNASMEDLRNPKWAVEVNGHVATEDLKNAGDMSIATGARGIPSQIELDASATGTTQSIEVSNLRVRLGTSTFNAAGALRGGSGNKGLIFAARLAPEELARLFREKMKPLGMVRIDGDAKLERGNLQLDNLQVAAMGARFEGQASLENLARYRLSGELHALDIHTLLQAMNERLPWNGIVSGSISAGGDLKVPGTRSVTAEARMEIAPGHTGIPVSGRLNLDYDGRADNVSIENSNLALPHTRLALNGSLERKLNVSLTSRDLRDLLAAVPGKTQSPLTLNGGTLAFNGAVTGSLSKPEIMGQLAANRFAIEGRAFDSLTASVTASGSRAAVRNGSVTRGTGPGAMQIQFDGAAGLRDWAIVPRSPVSADLVVRRADLADALALAGESPAGYSGPLTAAAHISGTAGNPVGAATLDLGAGTIEGEPVEQAQAQVRLSDGLVTIPAADIQSGAGRVDLTGEYRHPRDSFSTGTFHAHVQTSQIQLGRIRTVVKNEPSTSGSLQLTADVTADKDAAGFQITAVDADVAGRGIQVKGENYGDLSAKASTRNQTVAYSMNSDFAGATIRVNGATRLVRDYPTSTNIGIASLPLQRALAAVDRGSIPARGTLAATAQVNGSLRNPQGSAELTLTNAVLYEQPIDRAQLKVAWRPDSVDLTELNVASGRSRIQGTARYDHPAGDFERGTAQFNIDSTRLDLTQIRWLRDARPGLSGTVEIAANGAGTVQPDSPWVLFNKLNAHVAATGIAAQGKNFGNLTLTANTTAASRLEFALDSNLANADIRGSGTVDLRGDYPVNAQATFNDVLYTRIAALAGTGNASPSFEAAAEGHASINGPMLKPDQLRGALQLTRLNLTSLPRAAAGVGAGPPIAITNQGPIALTLDAGALRIQNAHLTGRDTDIQAQGTASLQALNLSVNANTDLKLLSDFDRDIDSSGKAVLNVAVRGTPSRPLVDGQLALRNAAFNYNGIENGISNANGTIAFNGNSARIQSLTGESGGGKVTLAGFVSYSDVVRFGLSADGSSVRILTQQGASVVVSAQLRLSGTTDNSISSGTVTVTEVNYNPQSDLGSILTRAAPPIQSDSAAPPLLQNMKLDIRVRTVNALTVHATLARGLQADADLRIRGTAATPGIVGRVTLNEGRLVFFGATYAISQGSVSFYNPLRIDPILDLTLETKAQTVSVVLHVTGPIDNMNLSYSSDPPLQFQEIVALLATGRTPTSDPTLLANGPQLAPASTQQMGESAILGQAVADPVSKQLARVFAVTQFKIDPSFVSGNQVPTARLTLQQQVTPNILFTYTSALDDPNGQIIRVEWAFSPRWAAVANRDQNGIFSINFVYKRQFR
ncbi:MAG TPA: translocation/assembly module TamB domain-containing protein [Bryobacteraceae bacterium]|jgi:translocation and assembly module TamB|nr:translocation/assembly module TamB domain-containing protein [Bryobacteraceae bacterium]